MCKMSCTKKFDERWRCNHARTSNVQACEAALCQRCSWHMSASDIVVDCARCVQQHAHLTGDNDKAKGDWLSVVCNSASRCCEVAPSLMDVL